MATRSVSESWMKATTQITSDPKLAMRTVDAGGIGSTQVTVPQGDLSVEPFSFTTSETESFTVDYIYIKFSTSVDEIITVTKTTSGIDEVLVAETVNSADNVRLVAIQNVFIDSTNGEQLKVDITNTGGSGLVDVVLKVVGV